MADENKKDDNRPISVNGEITPITKQKIEKIHGDQWSDMNINDLYEERRVLQNRMDIVRTMSGNPEMIKQIQRGLIRLDAVIKSKSTDDIGLIG